jgi:hypothetical protein
LITPLLPQPLHSGRVQHGLPLDQAQLITDPPEHANHILQPGDRRRILRGCHCRYRLPAGCNSA